MYLGKRSLCSGPKGGLPMNTERLREKKEVYRNAVLRLKEALDGT